MAVAMISHFNSAESQLIDRTISSLNGIRQDLEAMKIPTGRLGNHTVVVLKSGITGTAGAVNGDVTVGTYQKILRVQMALEDVKTEFRSTFRGRYNNQTIRPINNEMSRLTMLCEARLREHVGLLREQLNAQLIASKGF